MANLIFPSGFYLFHPGLYDTRSQLQQLSLRAERTKSLCYSSEHQPGLGVILASLFPIQVDESHGLPRRLGMKKIVLHGAVHVASGQMSRKAAPMKS